jgi:hypothetical protein
MLTRRGFSLLALGAPLAIALTVPRDSRAQGSTPSVEILVLYARKDPKGGAVDPRVPKIPQLSREPFNQFNAYAFVDKQTLKLDQMKGADPWKGKPSATYALPNGKPIQVVLLERLPGARFQMGAAIGADSPDVVRWDAPVSEPFFIAGQSYKDGILVLGISLRG